MENEMGMRGRRDFFNEKTRRKVDRSGRPSSGDGEIISSLEICSRRPSLSLNRRRNIRAMLFFKVANRVDFVSSCCESRYKRTRYNDVRC